MTNTKTTTGNRNLLTFLSPDALLPVILDYLDEASLCTLACVSRHGEASLSQCVSDAWIRLATRRVAAASSSSNKCHQAKTAAASATSAGLFPSAREAKAFLWARCEHLKAETYVCANLSCSNRGSTRCSSCKVAMYCSRDCQRQNWKHHKGLCQRITKTGEEICQLLQKEYLFFNPWGRHTLDFYETAGEDCAAVYAEFDGTTRQIRAFGSAVILSETFQEKRLYSDGKFYSVVALDYVFQHAVDNAIFHDALLPLVNGLMRIALIGSDADLQTKGLAIIRAMEGALTKIHNAVADNFLRSLPTLKTKPQREIIPFDPKNIH